MIPMYCEHECTICNSLFQISNNTFPSVTLNRKLKGKFKLIWNEQQCEFLLTYIINGEELVNETHFFSIIQIHCRQRAPVGIDLSSSGTSQLGMFNIQATTKNKYYDHIVLLYLESRRCRYRSIIVFTYISL
jgi:hypothetical protein